MTEKKEPRIVKLPKGVKVRTLDREGGALYPKEARGRTVKLTNETYAEFYKFIGQMQAETGERITPNTALHELLTRCKHERR